MRGSGEQLAALIDHLEKYLGQIAEGWSENPDGERMPFQVVRLGVPAGTGADAYATLGLSDVELPPQSRAGHLIRQELLLLAGSGLPVGLAPALLEQAGQIALDRGRAYLRGDVLGPYGPLVEGSAMEALYVSMPSYLPVEFATCEGERGRIVIAWLVPISAAEAAYVSTHGWSAFEDRLVEHDPDLTDFGRASLVLR